MPIVLTVGKHDGPDGAVLKLSFEDTDAENGFRDKPFDANLDNVLSSAAALRDLLAEISDLALRETLLHERLEEALPRCPGLVSIAHEAAEKFVARAVRSLVQA